MPGVQLAIEKAILFAVNAHQGQIRKGTTIPYVFHPLDVGRLLAQNDAREPLIVAGLLHDTLEDAQTTIEALKAEFGEEVAGLVSAVTELDKTKPWKERKTQTITQLRQHADTDVKLLECADKLSNITDTYLDLLKQGDQHWKKFNAGYDDQKWYYQELVKSLESLSDNRLYLDFANKVQQVFR